MQSEQIDLLVTALAIAQGEISPAEKSAENPHFKSKFANLTSIWEACRRQLSDQGIAVIQTIDMQGDALILITTLAHKSGQWIRSKAPILADKKTPQAIGSAITYMRRYSLAAIVGVAPEDDDGNEASLPKAKGLAGAPPRYAPPEEEVEEASPYFVSPEQAAKLEEIYSRCHPDHRDRVLDTLKKTANAQNFSQAPIHLYEKLMNSAKREIAKPAMMALGEAM